MISLTPKPPIENCYLNLGTRRISVFYVFPCFYCSDTDAVMTFANFERIVSNWPLEENLVSFHVGFASRLFFPFCIFSVFGAAVGRLC